MKWECYTQNNLGEVSSKVVLEEQKATQIGSQGHTRLKAKSKEVEKEKHFLPFVDVGIIANLLQSFERGKHEPVTVLRSLLPLWLIPQAISTPVLFLWPFLVICEPSKGGRIIPCPWERHYLTVVEWLYGRTGRPDFKVQTSSIEWFD